MKVAKWPRRRQNCRVAVRNSSILSAASSASQGAKVHSIWPGPHSFSMERSGSPSFSIGVAQRHEHRLHQIHIGFGMVVITGLGRRRFGSACRAGRARRYFPALEMILLRRSAGTIRFRGRRFMRQPRSSSPRSCLGRSWRGENWKGLPFEVSSHKIQPIAGAPREECGRLQGLARWSGSASLSFRRYPIRRPE